MRILNPLTKSTNALVRTSVNNVGGAVKMMSSQAIKYPARFSKEYFNRHKFPKRIEQQVGPARIGFIDKIKQKLSNYAVAILEKQKRNLDTFQEGLTFGVPQSVISIMEKDFDGIKETAIRVLKEKNADPVIIKHFKNCKTPQDLAVLIRSSWSLELLQNPYCAKISKSLDVLQEQYKVAREKIGDYVDLVKAITPESTDIKVKEIEGILQNEYGIEFARLFNQEEAQKALEAVKLAKQNNVPLPKNYIVTPFTIIGQNGTNAFHYETGVHSVLVQPREVLDETIDFALSRLGYFPKRRFRRALRKNPDLSTQHPIHMHLHELIHSEDKLHTFFNDRPIPEEFLGGLKDVGSYARTSNAREEIRTELKVKQILEGLSEEGKKTLEYLS